MDQYYDKISKQVLIDGEPCKHIGCLSNVIKSCDLCGRKAGKRDIKDNRYTFCMEIEGIKI